MFLAECPYSELYIVSRARIKYQTVMELRQGQLHTVYSISKQLLGDAEQHYTE